MITNLLSKNELYHFYDLMDQHCYSDALLYGQSLLDKDPFDSAGIRFGLMSACVILKDVESAEEIAQRIAKSMKKSMADVPFIQNKKKWLSYLDPAMLYPLAMVHWKVGSEKTGNTGNTAVCEYGAGGADSAGVASSTGSDKDTNKDIDRTLECLAAIKAWPGGWKMLKEFMIITASMNEGEYVVKRAKLQTMYNPITAEGLIACVNIDFKELKEFNAWIEEQKIPSKASGDDGNGENADEDADEHDNERDNEHNGENADKNADGENAEDNADKNANKNVNQNATVIKRKLTADEAVHDLTLALLYLSRISTSNDPAHYWDETSYKASKVFDENVLDWLDEVGFIKNFHSTHSNIGLKGLNDTNKLTITPSGVYRAREILDNLNINDWDKAEIAGKAVRGEGSERGEKI